MSLDDGDSGQVPAPQLHRHFRRDREHKKLLGVCAGIANYFDFDVVVVRIAFAVATILGFGSMILVYLAIALIAD